MGLFWPFANFIFWELLQIDRNESHGPSDQFPGGLRLLYFHTFIEERKNPKNGVFWALCKFYLFGTAKKRSNRIPWEQRSFLAGS